MEQNVIRKVTFLHEFGKTKRKFQESLCDKTEVIEAFLTDVLWDFTLETGIGSNGYDKFSEIDGDICDIISDFGKRETGILDLYMLAFKLAKEQLKISKED